MKSLSHMGGSQNIEEASSGNLPEWTRQTIQHLPRKEFMMMSRRSGSWSTGSQKDCGNVAYKDFFEKVAVPEVKERNEIFGFSRASAEKNWGYHRVLAWCLGCGKHGKRSCECFQCQR